MVSGIVRPLACCVAIVCAPQLARADDQPRNDRFVVALDYGADSGCPDAGNFETIVSARLGYNAFRKDAPDRVLVRITSRRDSMEGRIEWRDLEGNWAGDRTFPSTTKDCRELARVIAFALALQIQLWATAHAAPVAKPAPPAETAEIPATAPPEPEASPPPKEKEPEIVAVPTIRKEPAKRGPGPVLAIGAGALLGSGMASSPMPFGRMFGALTWPYAALELGAEVGWPTTTRRPDEAGFSQLLLLMSVAGCGTLQPWSACVVAKGGALRVAGKDIDVPASATSPVFAAGLRLAVGFRFWGQAFLAAKAEGLVNLVRWTVALDQLPVWTSPRFFKTIGLDIGVRFP